MVLILNIYLSQAPVDPINAPVDPIPAPVDPILLPLEPANPRNPGLLEPAVAPDNFYGAPVGIDDSLAQPTQEVISINIYFLNRDMYFKAFVRLFVVTFSKITENNKNIKLIFFKL